jgi:hypothetical protein
MEYDLYLREEAFEFLRGQPQAGREKVLGFLRGLRKDPLRKGDYTEHDKVGRDIEVVVVGHYAILFWADHPVKEIKVVELRLADR